MMPLDEVVQNGSDAGVVKRPSAGGGELATADVNTSGSEAPNTERLIIGVVHDGNDYDERLYHLLRPFGAVGFDFACYFIGGHDRAQMTPADALDIAALPPLSVPDCQMDGKLWGECVCGRISPWIDVDADNPRLAELSKRALEDELDYVQYLGLRAVMLELKHADAPKLAKLIRERLWKRAEPFRVWLVLKADVGNYDGEDMWLVWQRFRSACYNHDGLCVCLHLKADLPDEFSQPDSYGRWLAEPLSAVRFDTDCFLSDGSCGDNGGGALRLGNAHAEFLRRMLFKKPRIMAVLGGSNTATDRSNFLRPYKIPLDRIFENRPKDEFGDFVNGFEDHLQVPLQPQTEHLDSGTYETFEKDPIKYYEYEKAISLTLKRRAEDSEVMNPTFHVMVLGAGRGPLVERALQASLKVKQVPGVRPFRAVITAVEKNPATIVTLRFKNKTEWGGRVNIVHSDMRDYVPPPSERADIVVSELLGSFGDNELSPECLDGAAHLLKEDAVSIPFSYTSFLAPIQSTKIWNMIISTKHNFWVVNDKARTGHLNIPNGTETAEEVNRRMYELGKMTDSTDHAYVVRLQAYYQIDAPQPVFRFTHPNREGLPNTREETITFIARENSEVHGFAGYFDASLTEGNELCLSIVPEQHSEGMFSWFPAFFPLRRPVLVRRGDRLQLRIWRRVDNNGVWYEWQLCQPVQLPVQNEGGEAYFMRLC